MSGSNHWSSVLIVLTNYVQVFVKFNISWAWRKFTLWCVPCKGSVQTAWMCGVTRTLTVHCTASLRKRRFLSYTQQIEEINTSLKWGHISKDIFSHCAAHIKSYSISISGVLTHPRQICQKSVNLCKSVAETKFEINPIF